MASLCFLGQPSSGICCTLTPGRELAAASLISRRQAASLFHAQGCWSAGQGSPEGPLGSRTGLGSSLLHGWLRRWLREKQSCGWRVKSEIFKQRKRKGVWHFQLCLACFPQGVFQWLTFTNNDPQESQVLSPIHEYSKKHQTFSSTLCLGKCEYMSNPVVYTLYNHWTCFTFPYLHDSTIQS